MCLLINNFLKDIMFPHQMNEVNKGLTCMEKRDAFLQMGWRFTTAQLETQGINMSIAQ